MIQQIAIAIALIIAYAVWKDAEARGMDKWLWATFVFLIMIIGLPMYLFCRGPKLEYEDIEYEDEYEEIEDDK